MDDLNESNHLENNDPTNQTRTDYLQEEKAHKEKNKFFFSVNVIYRVLKSIIIVLFIGLLALGMFGLGAGVGYFGSLVKTVEVPDKKDLEKQIHDLDQQSRMTYADGSLISVIQSDLVRTKVVGKSISPLIKNALVATEDENFYEHQGIVPKAIARATLSDIFGVGSTSGGSTITQQLVKQQLLTNETSYKRKASEMLLALKTEETFSKEDILVTYLNVSPFGRNNHGENIAGIEEAAQGVFGVSAKDVSLPQAAFLAGLPQSPIEYTPYTNEGTMKEDVEAGLNRKNDVLYNMYRKKFISKEEYDKAKEYDLKKDFIPASPKEIQNTGFLYNYVYDEAARVLMPTYYEADGITEEEINDSEQLYLKYFEKAKTDISRNGYTIHSTIDKDIYNAMQEAVDQYGYVLDDGRGQTIETGSVLMDNKSGRIYGFIGGRNYSENQNNHAFQTRRSPGSTMKPILAYAPAIDVGLIGSESRLSDYPLKYHSGQEVKNYSDKGSNSFKTTRDALKWSLNIPVVNLYNQLLEETDPKIYFDKMNIGLNPDEYYRESIPLGGTDHGLTVLEETEAYATLANKGIYNAGYSIDKIVNNDGETIFEHEKNPVEVFKPATASIMNDMMRDVLKSGTGQEARNTLYSHSATLANADWVGKTGTSENQEDYWFTASTPTITLSSWIGYDEPTEMYKTWNKQNMIYWADVANYVYQRHPDIFGVDQKFSLDSSVKKEKVAEFTGEKPGIVQVNGRRIDLKGSKETTNLYATDEVPYSQFRFGIGGTDSNYQDAWRSFTPYTRPPEKKNVPKEKPKTKKETEKKKAD